MDNNFTQGTTRQRYSKLKQHREHFLDRAEECSEITIPSLIQPDGFTTSSDLYNPFQSVGARGVNNLASKLLLLLLPPNSPFFRLAIAGKAKEDLSERKELKTEVEKSLATIEREVTNKIEQLEIKNFNQINIKNVNFKYEDNLDLTLKNLNLKLIKGDFIGIRGETGVGKSTLVDLICGLLKPNSGLFQIDDKYLSDTLPRKWHYKIGYVPQNISLIDDTLVRNIALAINDNEINYEKINEIIKLSQLEKFINSHQRNSILGERGVQVSGGEKQRIGIARALYHDRPIYIFDEATNALDEFTENEILKSLKNHLKNKIVIIISHKPSTLSFCDRIYSLKNKELKITQI